jgi:hypothetical protein
LSSLGIPQQIQTQHHSLIARDTKRQIDVGLDRRVAQPSTVADCVVITISENFILLFRARKMMEVMVIDVGSYSFKGGNV